MASYGGGPGMGEESGVWRLAYRSRAWDPSQQDVHGKLLGLGIELGQAGRQAGVNEESSIASPGPALIIRSGGVPF